MDGGHGGEKFILSDASAVAIQEALGLRRGVEFEDMDAGMTMLDRDGGKVGWDRMFRFEFIGLDGMLG